MIDIEDIRRIEQYVVGGKSSQYPQAIEQLLAEVKRLREENDELHAQRVQISWIQEARGGQSKAFELLAEVKRLREQLAKANKFVYSICQHSDSMLMDYEDYMKGDD